jgi:hypothetical protein
MQRLGEWLELVGLVVEDPSMDDAGVICAPILGASVPILVVSPGVVASQCALIGSVPVEPLEAVLAVDFEASAKLYPDGWPSSQLEAGAAL